jgi:hypothetical protein
MEPLFIPFYLINMSLQLVFLDGISTGERGERRGRTIEGR